MPRGGRAGRVIAGPFPYTGRGDNQAQAQTQAAAPPLPPPPLTIADPPAIPDTFPDPVTELSQVLCNLGYPARIVRYIHDVEQLVNLQQVNQLQKDLIEPMFKGMKDRNVTYTTLQVSIFRTLHSFLRRMSSSRTSVNPATIDQELIALEQEYGEDPKSREGDKKIPFPSEGFKKDTDWLGFRDRFKNYLNSVKSSRSPMSLSYVIRPDVAPAGTDPADPLYTVALNGQAYRDDNILVYTYLVTLTQDGPGKTIIKQYGASRDRRAAFKLLDSTFTGGNYRTLLLNQAWNTISTKKFIGTSQNYTWSKFKGDFDEAFRQLEESDVNLDQGSKVYHLLHGIECTYWFESVNYVRQNLATNYAQASIYLANAVLTATATRNPLRNNRPHRDMAKVHAGRYKKDTYSERCLAKGALAYDDSKTGQTYILVFDQCFVDPEINASLICPNQLRDNGILVKDVPRRFDKTSTHCIKADELEIPLECKGYISFFNVRRPSEEELDDCPWVEMTGPDWDPHSEEHSVLEKVAMASAVGTRSTYAVDPVTLAKLIHVKPSVAEATLKATTTLANKLYLGPSYSSYGSRFRYLTRKHLKGRFWTDTFFGKESHEGFKAAQLFINEFRYTHVVLMKSKGEATSALRNFFDKVGLPDLIISDNSWEQGASIYGSKEWKSTMREFGVAHRYIEPYKYHQNYAENGVKLLKFRAIKVMEVNGVPLTLWDQAIVYISNLSNRLVHPIPRLEGRTPYEFVHGITPDISAFITFGFYEYVWYVVAPKPKFPEPKRRIGRWLGPSKSIVCDLVFKILAQSGNNSLFIGRTD